MGDEDNDGFEDLTETNIDGDTDNTDADTPDADNATDGDSEGEGELDDANEPDTAMDAAAYEATIAILQTENGLKDQEIERWKNINLQLLLSQSNDATVGTEDEDIDGDDPEPYSSVSGADSLFEKKES